MYLECKPLFICIVASLLSGCATVNERRSTLTNTARAAPIVEINAARKNPEMAIVPDEPAELEASSTELIHIGPVVGQKAPPILAEFVTGEGPATIERARGKVIILDFWATFCAPCQKSFSQYQALKDYFGENLAIIAVSVDDKDTDKARLEEFAQSADATFPVVWDKDERTARVYRLQKMPTAFIIDDGGFVRYIHAGYSDGTAEEMARQIKSLLAK